jgi:hypothetical protein
MGDADENLEEEHNMNTRLTIIGLAVTAALLSWQASAQTDGSQTPGAYDPNHPGVNEVDGRLQSQQNRINQGLADGQLTPGQAARDEKRDQMIQQQAIQDEKKNGGHLTPREFQQLNREENMNSGAIGGERQHVRNEERRHAWQAAHRGDHHFGAHHLGQHRFGEHHPR